MIKKLPIIDINTGKVIRSLDKRKDEDMTIKIKRILERVLRKKIVLKELPKWRFCNQCVLWKHKQTIIQSNEHIITIYDRATGIDHEFCIHFFPRVWETQEHSISREFLDNLEKAGEVVRKKLGLSFYICGHLFFTDSNAYVTESNSFFNLVIPSGTNCTDENLKKIIKQKCGIIND